MRKMCCSQPVIFKSLVPIQFLFTNPHPRRYAKKKFQFNLRDCFVGKDGLGEKKDDYSSSALWKVGLCT